MWGGFTSRDQNDACWDLIPHFNMCTSIDKHHRYSLPWFFTCPSSSLCARLLFPSLSLKSEETSLSVSAFSLLCVCGPVHTYSTCRHTTTCTHTHTQTRTHRACLLLLWWLWAVKTSLLSLALSQQSSLTELVYAGSQRLLSILLHTPFFFFLFSLSMCTSWFYLSVFLFLFGYTKIYIYIKMLLAFFFLLQYYSKCVHEIC